MSEEYKKKKSILLQHWLEHMKDVDMVNSISSSEVPKYIRY